MSKVISTGECATDLLHSRFSTVRKRILVLSYKLFSTSLLQLAPAPTRFFFLSVNCEILIIHFVTDLVWHLPETTWITTLHPLTLPSIGNRKNYLIPRPIELLGYQRFLYTTDESSLLCRYSEYLGSWFSAVRRHVNAFIFKNQK